MKPTKMLAILVLALASTAHGAQSLIVHDQPVDVNSIMLKVGQDVVIKVASDNYDSYTAYVGFDNGVVLGNFSYMMSWAIAGDLRDVTDYNLPAFYGYYIVANGLVVTPSPGDHFIFVYKAQQTGETTLKLYNETFSSVIDSVDIKVVAATMGTAFSYQGRVLDDNYAADGEYDFEFELYDAPLAGNQLANTFDVNDLEVIDGQFAVELDFGSGIFEGDGVWLQIAIRPGDSDANFTTFAPRQTIMPTPYALYAASAGIAVPLELTGSSYGPIISAINTNTDLEFTGVGVYGKCNNGKGVFGTASGSSGYGVFGEHSNGHWGFIGSSYAGVGGSSSGGYAVYGQSNSGRGVYGHSSSGRGVYGYSANGEGVYGASANGYAGYFEGGRNYFSGKVGIGTTDPPTKLAVTGLTGTSSHSNLRYNTANGAIYYYSSSEKYKEDIQPLEDDFSKILEVQPRSFIDKTSGQREIGFIAEEFDKLELSSLVVYNKDGQPDALKYDLVSLYLLEVMKDQIKVTKELRAQNDQLHQKIEALERAICGNQVARAKEVE